MKDDDETAPCEPEQKVLPQHKRTVRKTKKKKSVRKTKKKRKSKAKQKEVKHGNPFGDDYERIDECYEKIRRQKPMRWEDLKEMGQIEYVIDPEYEHEADPPMAYVIGIFPDTKFSLKDNKNAKQAASKKMKRFIDRTTKWRKKGNTGFPDQLKKHKGTRYIKKPNGECECLLCDRVLKNPKAWNFHNWRDHNDCS